MKPHEIMERWAAGDWSKDPDGGTCTAIMEAYKAGQATAQAEVERLTKAGEALLQHHINEDARISAGRDEARAALESLIRWFDGDGRVHSPALSERIDAARKAVGVPGVVPGSWLESTLIAHRTDPCPACGSTRLAGSHDDFTCLSCGMTTRNV